MPNYLFPVDLVIPHEWIVETAPCTIRSEFIKIRENYPYEPTAVFKMVCITNR